MLTTLTKQQKRKIRRQICLCVETGDYKTARKLQSHLLEEKSSNADRPSECKVKAIDGTGRVTIYDSARDASLELGIGIALLYTMLNTGDVVSRGKFRGYMFEKVAEE